MNILSIDWDYFFPVPRKRPEAYMYDWGMQEAEFFTSADGIWTSRAASFIAVGMGLPTTSGEEESFWSKVLIRPSASLWVADSHSALSDLVQRNGVENVEIWNFDAHHDGAYSKEACLLAEEGRISCDNWAYWARCLGVEVATIYPKWRERNPESSSKFFSGLTFFDRVPQVLFHEVFICRSGAWVPPWLDEKFVGFLKGAATLARQTFCRLPFSGASWAWQERLGPEVVREMNMGAVDEQVKAMRRAQEQVRGQRGG